MMAVMLTKIALQAGSAENAAPAVRYQVRYWTTEDGLPQHEISCLKQTFDGYLWIGTRFGLSRFDGVRFTSFDESTTPEITNESIDALAEDMQQTLWIGTPAGLLSYRDHQFERVPITTQQDQGVRRLTSSHSGGLWLCTSNSVIRYRDGQFACAWKAIQRDDDVISVREGADGWLNIFTRSKWLSVSPDMKAIRTNAVRQSSVFAWSAALPGTFPKSAWIGTKQGLFEVNGDSWKPIAEEALDTNAVELVFQDAQSNVWVGSRNGIFGKWDGAGWENIDFGEITGRSSAICMEQDAEGAIWIATTVGLVQLHKPLVVAYTERESIAHNKVWSVCEGYDHAIWVGTEQGLSRIDRSGEVQIIPSPAVGAEVSDRCLWPNRIGGVWTARNMFGLFACQNGEFLQAAAPALLSSNAITCLSEGRNGILYVCTEGEVLGFDQKAAIPWIRAVLHIQVPGVRSMLEADDGTLWLGTGGNGIVRVKDLRISPYSSSSIGGSNVWSIAQDSNRTIWLGTDKGLARYQNGSFFVYTRRDGLLEDRINCILADGGSLWLSGLSGIYRVQIAELNAVAEGKERAVQPYAIGTADGLKRAETNGEKQPAGWKASDGRLWFPTIRGVVAIDPRKCPAYERPPRVIIEQVKADGDIVPLNSEADQYQTKSASSSSGTVPGGGTRHQIAAGHGHVLEFQYTATSLIDSKHERFRYRLDGADTDWREETMERSVRYINLRPGNYRFQVTACNHHNVWNPKPVEFEFSLAPYFWQTKAFYGVSGAAVLAIAAGIQGYRLRWQHRLLKLEQQRALAAERARIARDLHDDLGTALTGLALELDVIGRDPKPDSPSDHRLDQAAERTRALAERMREVVWSVNPRCDTVPSLASFLEQQISQFLRADGIKVELDFPEDIPLLPIGGDARHQLALGVREALTNVIRHAQATRVVLSLELDDHWLVVQVKDNGRGLQSSSRNGDGLRNMRERIQSIGGTFDFKSEPGSGATIIFKVPLIKSKTGESI